MPVRMKSRVYVCAALFVQVFMIGGCNQNNATERATPETAVPATVAKVEVKGPERLILAFGDSLYAGYGLKRGESLPDDVEALLRQQGINAKVINAGVSGDTTAAGRKRLNFTLDNLPRAPDLVLLGLGGNDVLRQIPIAETRANLVAMLEELRKRNIPVVLTGMRAPPNLGPDYAEPFDRIYPELARSYATGLDPFVLAGVIGDRRLMLPDGVHPNAKGVDRMAARIAPIVADKL